MTRTNPTAAPALLLAAYQLAELEKTLHGLEIDATLDPVENVLAGMFAALPIQETAGKEPTKFFALVGGQWTPCHFGEQVTDKHDPCHGGLRWKAVAPNGDAIQGYAKPFEWAPALDGKPDWACLNL